jgi:hypothetical protein
MLAGAKYSTRSKTFEALPLLIVLALVESFRNFIFSLSFGSLDYDVRRVPGSAPNVKRFPVFL